MIDPRNIETIAAYQAFVARRIDRFAAAHPGGLPAAWGRRALHVAAAGRVVVDLTLAAVSVRIPLHIAARIVDADLRRRGGLADPDGLVRLRFD